MLKITEQFLFRLKNRAVPCMGCDIVGKNLIADLKNGYWNTNAVFHIAGVGRGNGTGEKPNLIINEVFIDKSKDSQLAMTIGR